MKSKITILNSGSHLDKYESKINNVVLRTLQKVEKLIEVKPLDIVIAHDPMGAIPGTGSGGYARNANLLWISLDADSKFFDKNLDKEIASTIAHEMHHCARMATVGYGETFWDSLITEGLADHFDIEINNGSPNPWSTALNKKELQKWYKTSRKLWENKDYDHAAWFFGNNEIPRWTGYSLGYHLVNEWIAVTGKSSSELVDVPSPPSDLIKL